MFGTRSRTGVLSGGGIRYHSADVGARKAEDTPVLIQAVSPAQVLHKVRSTVAAELENDSLDIDESTVIGDLPDWDSVAHFRIMIALENDFGILFDLQEHTEFETIGHVVDCICSKLATAAGV
jgi:acyl carrier protein